MSLCEVKTMYDEDVRTSTTTASGGWYGWDGTLKSPISNSGTNVSFHKKRWWDRSSSRPYHATLPYSVERFRTVVSEYRFDAAYKAYWGGDYRVEAGFYQSVDVDAALGYTYSPEISEIADELLSNAQNACFDNIAGAVWNAPVFFAELHKTGEMVNRWAKAISDSALFVEKYGSPRRALKALRKRCGSYLKGYRKPKSGVTSDLASFWLQWRYAVQTGVQDVRQAAQTTADLLLPSRQEVRVTQTRSGVVEMSSVVCADSAWGRNIGLGLSLGGNIEHLLSRAGHVEAKAWFTAVRKNSFLTDANQLGLLNFPLAVWELSFLSFVVDWVLDVGNYLERATAAAGFDLLDGGYQVFRRVSGIHSVRIYDHFHYETRGFISEGGTYEASRYNRSPWSYPTPVWTPKLRMNTNRWLDAASLLRQIPLGRLKVI
jgi:hypothetical protein